MTDADLDARFEAAFASVHCKPRVIDAYPPTVRQSFTDRPRWYQVACSFAFGFVGVIAFVALGVLYFLIQDATSPK